MESNWNNSVNATFQEEYATPIIDANVSPPMKPY